MFVFSSLLQFCRLLVSMITDYQWDRFYGVKSNHVLRLCHHCINSRDQGPRKLDHTILQSAVNDMQPSLAVGVDAQQHAR